jgi:hypothetical protein
LLEGADRSAVDQHAALLFDDHEPSDGDHAVGATDPVTDL